MCMCYKSYLRNLNLPVYPLYSVISFSVETPPTGFNWSLAWNQLSLSPTVMLATR